VTFIDMYDGRTVKRGDVVYSNVGDRRERTWLVLCALPSRNRPKGVPRYRVWMARWWELEPDMRMRLFRSAERNGGQNVIHFRRYPAKSRRVTSAK